MKRAVKWLVVMLAAVSFSPTLRAQEGMQNGDEDRANGKKITRYGITIEQDMFLRAIGLNEDRDYTMGLGLFLSNNKWASRKLFSPLRALDKLIGKDHSGIFSGNASVDLGLAVFTPRYLGNNQADSLYYMVNDRPFSSLIYLSFKYQSASLYRSEINQVVIGAIGLDIGKEAQTGIHQHHWMGTRRSIPYGWVNQISEGGEPTLLLSNKVDRLLSKKSLDLQNSRHIITQFIFSREYMVGYYTGASAAIAMRVGILDSRNWVSYDVYQLQHAGSFLPGKQPGAPRLKSEFYFQSSLRPQMVLYNALLNGQIKKNFHELSFQETRHIVIQAFAGVGMTLTNVHKNFGIGLLGYICGRSPEFKSGLTNRRHAWGGAQLVFTRIKP